MADPCNKTTGWERLWITLVTLAIACCGVATLVYAIGFLVWGRMGPNG